jgi:hypothetical protein
MAIIENLGSIEKQFLYKIRAAPLDAATIRGYNVGVAGRRDKSRGKKESTNIQRFFR